MRVPSPPHADLARDLAGWFRRHARKLTWRQTRDPYAIWVSEVMLQQTRVETVERYFSPFIQRFPSFAALAQAHSDEVLAMWSGLGYYRRARLLHRGAQYLMEQGQEQLPCGVEELRKIPGVGPYTAGAISSIAFDQPAALVDGNIARVSSRLRALEEPSEQVATAKGHWPWVQSLLEAGRPRELAQALMELGALVCTPRSPACDSCPLKTHCQAHARSLQGQIPAPKTKAKVLSQRWAALALLDRRGRLLFEQRPESGLLAGLWCLPLIELNTDKGASSRAESWIAAHTKGWPAALGDAKRWSDLRTPKQEAVLHIFTHRRWSVEIVLASYRGELARSLRSRKRLQALDPHAVTPDAFGGGVPKLTQKVIAAWKKLTSPSN